MNPGIKVWASVRLNGVVTDLGQTELKYVPTLLTRFILDTSLNGRDLSSIELRLSKRQIKWDSEPEDEVERLLLDLPPHLVTQVDDSDPIDDLDPPITYRELNELSLDPIWTAYRGLKNQKTLESLTASEHQAIIRNWQAKYQDSKFARLIDS